MRRLPFYYGWLVIAVTFVSMLVAGGVRSAPGALMLPMESYFGWDRSVVSMAASIHLMVFGLSGPFMAAFIERFGVRRMMIAALLLLALGTGFTAWIRSAWQLDLLWGIVAGLGSGVLLTVMGATVANRWFMQKRGTALGILTAAAATGQLIFLPLLAHLAQMLRWQTIVWVLSASALLAIVQVLMFMRNAPADLGLLPLGASQRDETGRLTNHPLKQAIDGLRLALGTRDFWLLSGSFFVCGLSTTGLVSTHFIPASAHHGIPEVTAAGTLALMGLFDVWGTVISGWLSDRIDNRRLLFWYYGLRGLSLLYLPFAMGSAYWKLIFFAVFYGLDWVATMPPTIRLTTRRFGNVQGVVIYGWIYAVHQLGSGAAAYGGGLLFRETGGYWSAFVTAGAACLLSALLVLGIGKAKKAVAAPNVSQQG